MEKCGYRSVIAFSIRGFFCSMDVNLTMRRPTIASALDQNVQNLALVIDGAPARRTTISSRCQRSLGRGRPLVQPSRDRGTELQHPSPHRFAGDVEPSFGQHFLDIAAAQGEAEIKPDRLLDDLGRKAMGAVAERSHADILSDTPLAPDPVSVTMPNGSIQARLHHDYCQRGRDRRHPASHNR